MSYYEWLAGAVLTFCALVFALIICAIGYCVIRGIIDEFKPGRDV